MITYDYKCKDCGVVFEIVKPFGTVLYETLVCSNCHSKNIERVWNVPAVILRGTGWTRNKMENNL